MNIVDVVISKLKAESEEELFKINSILANPTKDNAIPDLKLSLLRYSEIANTVRSADRLKHELDKGQNFENKNNTDNS